jgi:hypothetical protein
VNAEEIEMAALTTSALRAEAPTDGGVSSGKASDQGAETAESPAKPTEESSASTTSD